MILYGSKRLVRRIRGSRSMINDQLQTAITQTCDAIQANIIAERHSSKYERILIDHLQCLLELQKVSLSCVGAGKIVLSERSNHD